MCPLDSPDERVDGRLITGYRRARQASLVEIGLGGPSPDTTSSGRVATAWFSSSAVASAFAAAWARRLGHSVVVRRLSSGWPCAPAWVVSVPIAVWGLSSAHGQVLVAGGGGVRGVAASLRALGFVSASA